MASMNRYFNISGTCFPDKHYMVDLSGRLSEIRKLVERGDYFTVNRARQYGKTTLLHALALYLRQDYAVISISFQRMSSARFRDEHVFAAAFAETFLRAVHNRKKQIQGLNAAAVGRLEHAAGRGMDLTELFTCLSELCATADRPLILMIDEVDSASNNQVFLDFLAQLRDAYLDREETPTFQSVILAGVYDIRNLKQKIRPHEEHRYNSPWNIAARFTLDMSFSADDIAGMISAYSLDRGMEIDVPMIAGLIYDYTSGYPFLVSCICKMLDEQVPSLDNFRNPKDVWTAAGVSEAVRIILKEPYTLFDDMRKKLDDYPELRAMLYSVLFNGRSFPYNPDSHAIDIGTMFGFIKEADGAVAVANRIFETRLYNLFLAEDMLKNGVNTTVFTDRNQFIRDGYLDMDLVMAKFVRHFTEIYGNSDASFIEENGRRLFLLYLKPIINGAGNYYIEARTRNLRRTDVIVDYRGRQYVIEMKIWHGEEYNRRGEIQLSEYLAEYHLEKGYLLSFCFNKNKTPGIQTVKYGEMEIVEAIV